MFKKWFIEPTDSSRIQFFRYIFVGGAAFIVDYGVLLLLNKKFGLYYQYAALISFVLGLGVNYWLSMALVFHRGRNQKDFIAFVITGLIGLLLNQLLLSLFTDGLRLDVAVSKPITTVLVFVYNFIGRRLWLYRKPVQKAQ